jgi:PAS domain S-box-containing protein
MWRVYWIRVGGAGGAAASGLEVYGMTMRKKIILYSVYIFTILIICVFVILQVTVVERFQQYEREEMAEEVNRGINVLASDLENMDMTLKDWSSWDDSYSFLEDRNENYISSNLNFESLKNFGIDVVLFVKPSGEILYETAYDLASGEEVPLPDGLLRHLAPSDRLMSFSTGEDGTMGILMVDQTPLLVAARPVLTSIGGGPSRGTLIIGSFLDNEHIDRLAKMVALDLSILPVDDPGVPPQALTASNGSPGAEPVFTQSLSSSRIAGYALVTDLYGDSALVMRVDAERDLYQHGQVFLRYLILVLFIAGLVFAGAILIMLEKMVLKPLARFSGLVNKIDTERDLSQRLGAEKKDELSNLAVAIDVMLDNLEHTWQEWQSSEQALRESGEKYRKLMESAGDAIFVVDADSGLILEVNQRAEKLMGSSALELEGMHQALLHPPEEEELYRGLFAAHAQEGRGYTAEAVVVNKEGVRVPVEINARALEVGGRKVVQGIFRDITERKRAEEELESMNHLFLSLGPDLMENIVRVVGAAKEILGVPLAAYTRLKEGKLTTLSTALGEEGLAVTKWLEGNISYELISRGAKEPMIIENLKETDYRYTDQIVKEHGFESFLGYPVGLGIQTIGCLCLFDDAGRYFSDQDQETAGTLARALSIEEERLAREENLKDFIDIASHELRHPITVLKGYSNLLRTQRDKMDDATQDITLEIIDHGSDRLDSLVEGLLDISRIERGRFEVRREPQSLDPLIERSIDEMGARGFNNVFSSRFSSNLEECSVDGEKFVQLMVILMENAQKYSPSGSPIEVEAGETEGGLLVSVLDRGMGISEEHRELIFSRFFQVEEVAHHSTPGMGMGLYIARNIVEAHGGRIWCEAREGGGSVFHFIIPRRSG